MKRHLLPSWWYDAYFDKHKIRDFEVLTNSKSKIYSDGSKNIIVCSQRIFKDKSFEPDERRLNELAKCEAGQVLSEQRLSDAATFGCSPVDIIEFQHIMKNAMNEVARVSRDHSNDEVRHDSVKRAKDTIFDYILNNDFEYFFTGTIDPEKMDSKDPRELLKPLRGWLNNMQKRYSFSYIMIAERHKSGAIHFHGLFKAADTLRLQYSGTKLYKGYNKPVSDEKAQKLGLENGRPVYNLKSWRFGWTTAIKLQGDRINTAFYVTKYITKDCKKIFGRFFWHSRDLKKPHIIYENMDFEAIEAGEHNGFKYIFEGLPKKEQQQALDNGAEILKYLEQGIDPSLTE